MPDDKGVFCGDKRYLTALILFSPFLLAWGYGLLALDKIRGR